MCGCGIVNLFTESRKVYKVILDQAINFQLRTSFLGSSPTRHPEQERRDRVGDDPGNEVELDQYLINAREGLGSMSALQIEVNFPPRQMQVARLGLPSSPLQSLPSPSTRACTGTGRRMGRQAYANVINKLSESSLGFQKGFQFL